ncbi:diiron oxygenase [Streptomyces sp. NPDC057302]|uniref:AurF N-oxygenase family protein n=1 Tax=Streptomyces sp. NPDC057302 TaxID=3346094 RepID=UPI00363D2606
MVRPVKVLDSEQAADRLLAGSVKRAYDPVIDVDWGAPLDPDKFFLPPRLISLYKTPLWEGMTRAERIELSRHEMANIMGVGIWFENILVQALLRKLLGDDPTSRHTHYALTEMGDECRHMLMFGKLIDTVGARPYRKHPVRLAGIKALPFAFRGTMLWVAALIGEEIFDALQRDMMDDPELQPLVHQVMRIHVTEEARHITYARQGVVRRMANAGPVEKQLAGRLAGLGGPFMDLQFINPEMYRRSGLDAREAVRQARSNPHHRQARIEGFAKLAAFLQENDLLKGQSLSLWRRAGFVA